MSASERSRGEPFRAAEPSAPRGGLARRVRSQGGAGGEPGAESTRRVDPARGDFLERLVHLLDSQFRIPVLGVRFGLDPILGLLPGAGDLVGAAMGLVVLTQARREGARAGTLGRMAGNLLIDLAVGAIPIVGDVFDVWFKANRRNLRLLHEDRARRGGGRRRS